jgi:hypothetical protein
MYLNPPPIIKVKLSNILKICREDNIQMVRVQNNINYMQDSRMALKVLICKELKEKFKLWRF